MLKKITASQNYFTSNTILQKGKRTKKRVINPKSTEYTFFAAPHSTYSKIDHIIGSKSLLSKCKGMEIITNSLSDHSAIKLELVIKKLTQKLHKFMENEQLALEC